MKKIICSILAATMLCSAAEVFANDLGFAALGAGIGALANGKRGAAVGALIGYGFSAAGRPQYDNYGYGGYGYRPSWLNGPYCGEDSVRAYGGGCVRVYGQPAIYAPPPVQFMEAPAQQTTQAAPSQIVIINNYIQGDTSTAGAEKYTPKKIPKKIRRQKVMHPTGGY